VKPRISLDNLLLFYDVVSAESINKAADKLGLPKSSISRRLSELESTVGSMLVKRGHQGLILTDVGKLLYERCGRIVAELEEAGVLASGAQADVVGSLRVSLPMDFWMSWFGKAVCEFAAEHPALHMELLCHDRFVDVSAEPFDVAIHVGDVRNSSLTIKHLGTLSRGFYASPGYVERRGEPATIQEIAGHDPIVMLGHRDTHLWEDTTGGGSDPGIGRFVVNSVGFARELALYGQGVAILPNILCAGDVTAGRLVRLLPDHRLPPIPVCGSFISRKHLPRKTRAFLDFVAERLIEEAPRTPPPRS